MSPRPIFFRDYREIPSESQVLIRQVAALRQMGIIDPHEMAAALALSEQGPFRVRDVDRLYNIHRFMTYGMPEGMFVEIPTYIKCPGCQAKINVIPCVQCRSLGKWPNKFKDTVPQWDLD